MELEKVLKELKARNFKKIFVQLPEGLVSQYENIAKTFEKENLIPVISIETTYGFCDLRDEDALRLGCDALVHFGHNNFGFERIEAKIPVYFVEWYFDLDCKKILDRILEKVDKEEKIGLAYSLQYKRVAEKILEVMKSEGFDVELLGQILGCNISNLFKKDKDRIFIISSGKFYGLYPSIKLKNKIFLVDVEENKVIELDSEVKKIIKIKEWNKKIFQEAKTVGLLVSWKKGQIKDWLSVYEKIKKMGKEVYILAFDELEEKMLEGIKLDILVNLACPRLGVDDISRFKIPILNLEDII